MPYHCSTLAECANGDLLSLWYGGSYEADDDQKLWLAGRKKGDVRLTFNPDSFC